MAKRKSSKPSLEDTLVEMKRDASKAKEGAARVFATENPSPEQHFMVFDVLGEFDDSEFDAVVEDLIAARKGAREIFGAADPSPSMVECLFDIGEEFGDD